MPVRVIEPNPRVDAIRGCVALERGPLVYCLEGADLPAGVELEDLLVARDRRPRPIARPSRGRSAGRLRLGWPLQVARRDGRGRDRDRRALLPVGQPRRWRDAGLDPGQVAAPARMGSRLGAWRRRLAHDEARLEDLDARATRQARASRARSIASWSPSAIISAVGIRSVVSAGTVWLASSQDVVEPHHREHEGGRTCRGHRRHGGRRRRGGRSRYDRGRRFGQGQQGGEGASPPARLFRTGEVVVGHPTQRRSARSAMNAV